MGALRRFYRVAVGLFRVATGIGWRDPSPGPPTEPFPAIRDL